MNRHLGAGWEAPTKGNPMFRYYRNRKVARRTVRFAAHLTARLHSLAVYGNSQKVH